MPATTQRAGAPRYEVDRDSHTIRFNRVFDAAPSLIFEAWTQPEQVRCWWDATGEPLLACDIDLRPGGVFRFVNRSHPDMAFAGTYREIAPPLRLVFEAMGAIGRVILREVDGKTHLSVEIECRSADQLEQYMKIGIHTGTSQTLDNLVGYVRNRYLSDELIAIGQRCSQLLVKDVGSADAIIGYDEQGVAR